MAPTRAFKADAWHPIDLAHSKATAIGGIVLMYGALNTKAHAAAYALVLIARHLKAP